MSPAGFRDVGLVVFRVPLLPVETFQQTDGTGGMAAPTGSGPEWHEWSPPLDLPEFRNALSLQSPSLASAIERAGAGALDDNDLRMPLYRYAGRAALGCAPRGLFASACIGRIAERTDLCIDGVSAFHVRAEIALDYLTALADQLFSGDKAQRGIPLSPNPTLVLKGDTITLWENPAGEVRSERQIALQASTLLRRLVARLGTRQLSGGRLRGVLRAEGVPTEVAGERMTELLAARIVLPALTVSTVERDPVGKFVEQLPRTGPLASVRESLSSVHSLRGRDWGNPREISLCAIGALGRKLPAVPGFEHANRQFQIETQVHAPHITLGRRVVGRVARAVERLHFAFADMHGERLGGFAEAFVERYGDATVPLLDVLDLEHGLGSAVATGSDGSRWQRRGRRPAMLKVLHRAWQQRQTCIDLDESFWNEIGTEDLPELPGAFSAVCCVVAESAGAADLGNGEIVLQCVMGTTGSELWGRHARQSESMRMACEEVRRHLAPEDGEVVRADVSVTPRLGSDVMARPASEALRIECSIAARPGDKNAISLSELFVQVCDGRVRLLSKRPAREVVPIVGSAVDPAAVPSLVFRFLSQVAFQRCATPLAWSWGELVESPFLPRVRWGGVVLAPARWRVELAEIKQLPNPRRSAPSRERWTEWRSSRDLPRWVSLCDGEDRLGCDLGRSVGIELLLKEAARNGVVVLEELRVGPDELCVSDGGHRYAHDLIVPFVRDDPPLSRRRTVPVGQTATWGAKFSGGVMLPGSEWVYAKLYASPRRIQAMLRKEVPALVSRLRRECGAKDWFFFRYRDTDWHLRLRVRASTRDRRERVRALIDTAAGSLERGGAVWRVQYDTYFRELERFGGEASCRWVERLFAAESDLALVAFQAWRDEATCERECMNLALGWVFWAWSRLGLTRVEIAGLSRALRLRMLDQGEVDRKATLISGRSEPAQLGERSWRAAAARAGKVLDRIRVLAETRALGVTMNELAGDLSHLFVNRLFMSRHAEREALLYAALERHAHSA